MSPFPNPLGDSFCKFRTGSEDFVIPLMFLLAVGAVIINFSISASEEPGGSPESPGNRQIILDVPETSRVDAQVTSENTTLNFQNL